MNAFTPVRVSLPGVAAALGSLAFIVYWIINHPGQSTFPLFVSLLISLLAAAVGMVAVMSLPKNASRALGRTAVGSWMVCLVAGAYAVLLAVPQMELAAAQKNIDGETPAVVLQVSEQLRAKPWALNDTAGLLRPVLQSSTDPARVDLFREARSLGVDAEVIDRVLANGFVHPDDKDELVQALLVHAQSNGPGITALLSRAVADR